MSVEATPTEEQVEVAGQVAGSENAAEQEAENSSTRPQNVSRHSESPREGKRVKRFTLDLDQQQHQFLRLFAVQNGIQASLVMRALLYLLETDRGLAERIVNEIFADDLVDIPGEE